MEVTVEYAEGGLCRIAVDGEMTIFTALTLKLVDQLSVYLGGGANARALVKAAQVPAEYERPHTTQGGGEVETDHWHLSLRFGADVLRNGMDPLSFVRYLATLGQIVQIVTLIDGIPGAASMDPESCHLGFEIGFKSQADKATIEGVFEFMRDDCRIRILPPHSKISEYLELLSDLPQEQDDLLGDMLVRCGTPSLKPRCASIKCSRTWHPHRAVGGWEGLSGRGIRCRR